MLPSSKSSLISGGFTSKQAAWILIAGFLAGVMGISIVSRIIHQFMPSHIVDCEHTHDPEAAKGHEHANGHAHVHNRSDSHSHSHRHRHEDPAQVRRAPTTPKRTRKSSLPGHFYREQSEYRPSSRRSTPNYFSIAPSETYAPTVESELHSAPRCPDPEPRRPSFQQRLTSSITQLTSGKKDNCDCNGPCYGFSEPCGQECFKNVNARGGFKAPGRNNSGRSPRLPLCRNTTVNSLVPTDESTPLLADIQEESRRSAQPVLATVPSESLEDESEAGLGPSASDSPIIDGEHSHGNSHLHKTCSNDSFTENLHHHHVPSNAFLSIGLQTSIAIALHKLPEGFITYATNHANPKLGFSVFLALFIHNITEGFAMALPLYLAINSRWKAMLVSFVLGGLSQPIGAGVAAGWFWAAGDSRWAPNEGVYGVMFAVTAGIMASVALQLFSESLDLTHSKMLCMIGAFTGMGVLGISSALTA